MVSLWTERLSLIDPLPDRPRGPTNLLHHGYRVAFPGVERPGRGVDHPYPSSAEVEEIVELYLYSAVPSCHVTVWPLPLHCGTFSFPTCSAIIELPVYPVRRLLLHISEHYCCALRTACHIVNCALRVTQFAFVDKMWIRQV